MVSLSRCPISGGSRADSSPVRWGWALRGDAPTPILLFPLTLKRKSCPIVWRGPPPLLPHINLRTAQRRRRTQTVAEHALIEQLYQFSRRPIIHFPETGDHARRARIEKAARQAYQSFALDLFTQSGLTGAEHDQISREP